MSYRNPYGRCRSCRFSVAPRCGLTGSKAGDYSSCSLWHPMTRELGELRQRLDRKYLRFTAVRILYEAGRLTRHDAEARLAQRHSDREMVVVRAAIEAYWAPNPHSRILAALEHRS